MAWHMVTRVFAIALLVNPVGIGVVAPLVRGPHSRLELNPGWAGGVVLVFEA